MIKIQDTFKLLRYEITKKNKRKNERKNSVRKKKRDNS